jgi:large subunit ribosomal protein L29
MLKKIDYLRSVLEMNDDDLKAKIQEDELRLKKLGFAHAVSPLENPMTIRGVRKDLARLKTELKKRQLSA